jgi:hypothetical protein
MRFISENLRRTKGLNFLFYFIFFVQVFFFYYGVSIGIRNG